MAREPEPIERDATDARESACAAMLERGLADSLAGRVISHEEMGRRIQSWRKVE